MVATDFEKFVASQQDKAANDTTDWDGIRNEWLRNLDTLYRQIAQFLQQYVKVGSISYSFTELQLTEENLGTYVARRMDIRIGRQNVHLEPIGILLIACKGRVDVVGSAGRAQILLLNEKAGSAADLIKVTVSVGSKSALPSPPVEPEKPISWAWKIVTHTAQKTFIDLNKESFFALLMEVANA
jgi:hypothetical protein